MRTGRIDPADGTKLMYALSVIDKLIESGELEIRLRTLEDAIAAPSTDGYAHVRYPQIPH